MSDVGSVNTARTGALNGARTEYVRPGAGNKQSSGRATADRRDQVDLSELARLKSRIRDLPPVRDELVQRIRTEIEAGEYETADKIEQAVDAIIRESGE